MSFGAEILFGDDNQPLPPEVAQWLAEVRVEHELNKPAKFALRFEDDLCGDAPAVSNRPELRPNTMLSVMVANGNSKDCLVRGRVTQIKSSSQLGGPGSWIEAHCLSRQVEMDRETFQVNWAGPEKDIVTSVLQGYDFQPDVKNVQDKTYDDEEQLNQRGTDFAFLNKLASENGVDFWISYETSDPNPLTGESEITEHAHFRISPEVPDGAFDIGGFELIPNDDTPSFRVNVLGDDCPNVNLFTAEVDAERPNAANGQGVDLADGAEEDAASEESAETQGDGPTLSLVDGVQRTVAPAGPGTGEDQTRRQDAMLRASSWFVEAKVSTSAHMLGAILSPHDIIDVKGAGPEYSIPYQVKSVIHVINAADHLMDVTLRSNFIGEAA
ncbi:hypothetical protein [Shimia sp. Alg240-R146]|uniref:hypothetical protein n=1 Tax=Shimia sp. Alg240-R146 TaxID=2993449 RepID=UPI0022E99085|nr:hypothetical protein [Shimia sp. Alg240-R146]